MRCLLVGALASLLLATPVQAGGCVVPVEYDAASAQLRLRADHGHCALTEDMFRSVLGLALDRAAAERRDISVIFLGRLVDYPWASDAMATFAGGDPGWDAVAGRATDGRHDNAYFADALLAGDTLAGMAEILGTRGYGIESASAEKVLKRQGASGEILPFDAIVHLRLAPTL